jgi:putative restriction endonuclease
MATAYVGLTDPDWYTFLSSQRRLDEVNFWRPHGGTQFGAIPRGAPFVFKLRAPDRAIAGFGFFERFEEMPAWLAWECFGTSNGAATFEEFVERIVRLRGDGASASGDFEIGCVLLTAPVFFSKDQLVEPPRDWARTGIQQGKRYDVATGEGARVWVDCLRRAHDQGGYWNVEPLPAIGERYGAPIEVRPRLGQGTFSLAVRDAYSGSCAVTREHSLPVLEAAHIKPYAEGGVHAVSNGLLLRSDLHRLYDRGYVTVMPDFTFKVSERLRSEYRNGKTYYALDGSRIHMPAAPDLMPDRSALEWHANAKFRAE